MQKLNDTMKNNSNWHCEATVIYWDHIFKDYCEIVIDHYSNAATARQAEIEAREVWSDHGHNPEIIIVKMPK